MNWLQLLLQGKVSEANKLNEVGKTIINTEKPKLVVRVDSGDPITLEPTMENLDEQIEKLKEIDGKHQLLTLLDGNNKVILEVELRKRKERSS